ncbi:MAG: M13 family metallopeptidase N-terminal domain-containing protein, partial [Flavobacterium sp.]
MILILSHFMIGNSNKILELKTEFVYCSAKLIMPGILYFKIVAFKRFSIHLIEIIQIMKKSLILFIAFLAFTACSKHQGEKNIAITGIDSTLRPGDDFFKYVNGKWYDSVKIPPSQAGVGAYMFMNYPQRMRLQGILDSISKSNNPAGSTAQKVGDFYASGMDTLTIDIRGYTPIKPLLVKIEAISDLPSLMKFVVNEVKGGNSSIIAFGVSPDDKNSSMNIAQIYQTGIG